MKKANVASYATAMANGMCRVDEFADDEDSITVVYAITKDEWNQLER